MRLRAWTLAIAGLGIPLALAVMVLPITWGYGGYLYFSAQYGANGGIVEFVNPQGPAFRAGLRAGDRFAFVNPSPSTRIASDAGPVGTVDRLSVIERNGRSRQMSIRFVPFSGKLEIQETTRKLLSELSALLAFVVALLIAFRARDARVAPRAALVLLLIGFDSFVMGAALVCGSAMLAAISIRLVPPLVHGLFIAAALWLLAIYPPNPSRLRRAWLVGGVLAIAWGTLLTVNTYLELFAGRSGIPDIFSFVASFAVPLVFYALVVVALVDGMLTAGPAYSAPMRWLAGMWFAGFALLSTAILGVLFGNLTLASHEGDALRSLAIFFFVFGLAYPVLRHRMVDLNILVSRATVFTIVSAIIVGLFVGAEWIISRLFERSLGLSSSGGGAAAQGLMLAVVLVLGISARSIHRFVEERMMRVFFRKRMRGLAEIERIAREADVAGEVLAFTDLAAGTAQAALEMLAAAFYVRSDDGAQYVRTSASGELALPASYRYDDAPPLRLRRWQQPFEVDDESEDRHHMLFLPMTVRGELLGFMCCGPKRDRTAYLAEEIAPLALLADRVGIASALLAHDRHDAEPTPLVSGPAMA